MPREGKSTIITGNHHAGIPKADGWSYDYAEEAWIRFDHDLQCIIAAKGGRQFRQSFDSCKEAHLSALQDSSQNEISTRASSTANVHEESKAEVEGTVEDGNRNGSETAGQDEFEDEDGNEEQQYDQHDLANAIRDVFVHVRQKQKPAKLLLDSGASLNFISKEKILDWTLSPKVKKRSKEDQITLQLGNGSQTVVRGSLELHWGVRNKMRTFTSIFYVCDHMPCDMVIGVKECLKRGLIRFEGDEGASLCVMISTKSKAEKRKIQKLQREADKGNAKKTGEQMGQLAQELQRVHIQPSPTQDRQDSEISGGQLDRLILESILQSYKSLPGVQQRMRGLSSEKLMLIFKNTGEWDQHKYSVLRNHGR